MKGLIPIETLAQMPLPFVHRLRDLRIQQLEAKRRQNEIMASRMPNPSSSAVQNANAQSAAAGDLDESAIEEIVEGLT
jgi:hypothetical protein